VTDAAEAALASLRSVANFDWAIVAIGVLVLYVYASAVKVRDWPVVFGGIAFLLADVFNELWNSAFFHLTGRAPVWAAPGHSSYQILIGWNIEIVFMFAILGVTAAKLLPPDPGARVLSVNNRIWFVAINAALAVGVEMVLNRMGYLTWDWWWWSTRFPFLIWLIGYVPFFAACAYVHDLPDNRARIKVIGAMLGVVVPFAVVLGVVGWL
jgi:hypothetical protein